MKLIINIHLEKIYLNEMYNRHHLSSSINTGETKSLFKCYQFYYLRRIMKEIKEFMKNNMPDFIIPFCGTNKFYHDCFYSLLLIEKITHYLFSTVFVFIVFLKHFRMNATKSLLESQFENSKQYTLLLLLLIFF